MKTVFYPKRFWWLVPIMLLGAGFDDPNIGVMFTLCLALVTSRIFPIMEFHKEKE